MRVIVSALLLVMAGVLQVTFASLFPLRAAVLDFGLLTVVVIALTAGPRAAMVAVPAAALTVGFTNGREPGLLLLSYLPLLPLAAFLEETRLPTARYVLLAGVVVVSGVWARTILSLGPLTEGADFDLTIFVRDLLLPGVVLDWLAFTVIYAPLRLLGQVRESLTLERSRYFV